MPESVKKILFPAAIGICAIIFFLLTNQSDSENIETQELQAHIEPTAETAAEDMVPVQAIVDIKGEVIQPGVYEVQPDSRVNDVIQMAGGFTEDADQTQINLAQKIQDEMIIIVHKKGEEGEPQGTSTSDSAGQKVRVNYASQEEIETLNGIGPAKAQAIIQYREENGLFQTPEDLLQVSGIGEKTLQNFIDQIQIP